MAAINEFLTFAGDPAAHVMTQAQYAALTARTMGFQTGTAQSLQLNKAWRQSSLITHMISDFVVKQTPAADMKDDGSPNGLNTLRDNFINAIKDVASKVDISGYLPLSGGTISGELKITPKTSISLEIYAPVAPNPVGDAHMFLSRTSGHYNWITGRTGALDRWAIAFGNGDQESATDGVGSNFTITRFHNNGNWWDEPFSISRQTGVVDFAYSPTVAGGNFPYLRLSGGGTLSNGNVHMQGSTTGIQYDEPFPLIPGKLWQTHAIGFGWDGNAVRAKQDGNDVGTLATQEWSGSKYLLLTGGTLQGSLVISGPTDGTPALTVNGVSYLGKQGTQNQGAIFLCGQSDFFINAALDKNGKKFRAIEWSGAVTGISGWADAWSEADNTRRWYTSSSPGSINAEMILTQDANLHVDGTFHADGGITTTAGAFAAMFPPSALKGGNVDIVAALAALFQQLKEK